MPEGEVPGCRGSAVQLCAPVRVCGASLSQIARSWYVRVL